MPRVSLEKRIKKVEAAADEEINACESIEAIVWLSLKKTRDEDETTAEEESNHALAEDATTSESDVEIGTAVAAQDLKEEQERKALRRYSQRFGRDSSGHELFTRTSFVVSTQAEAELLPELDQEDNSDVQDKRFTEHADMDFTFGYAGSLDKNPPFVKFDIRDDVCLSVGGFKHGQLLKERSSGAELVVVGVHEVDGTPRLWFHPIGLGRAGAGAFRSTAKGSLKKRLEAIPSTPGQATPHFRKMRAEDFDIAEDSDGEELILCHHCKLPVGTAYRDDKVRKPAHGECMAQLTLTSIKEQEEATKHRDAQMKIADRKNYDIGWKAEEAPRNSSAASLLGCSPPPEGMCCLVFDPKARTVDVASTLEPAESVNLEYLSLSLRVRSEEAREPLFSLDPIDGTFDKDSMQFKRFEPEWLAGTSVGEVMFQADYHLKELSMGECAHPVVGMKSCFDFSAHQTLIEDWSAREWFVVRKAEILMTEGKVLVPRVRMGVEARETTMEDGKVVDLRSTQRNHPMVKYTEIFTHYFDLIAERRSVVFHLRELAKAAVIAKMLIDTEIHLEGQWFNLAGQANEVCPMEVPQLWNLRNRTRIVLRDGIIVESKDGKDRWRRMSHGVYGGVNFGLERAAMSTLAPVSRLRTMGLQRRDINTGSLAGQPSGTTMFSGPRVGPQSVPIAPGVLSSAGTGRARAGLAPFTSAGHAAGQTVRLQESELMPLPDGAADSAQPMSRLMPSQPAASSMMAKRPQASLTAKSHPLLLPRDPRVTAKKHPLLQPWDPRSLPRDPRGVDLNLSEFNLSEPVAVENGSLECDSDVNHVGFGRAFWKSLDQIGNEFSTESRMLLEAVFHPNLSDRRLEGEHFVPPDTSSEYVQRLRNLVREEEDRRQQRIAHFLSDKFAVDSPGDLFPFSWGPSTEMEHGKEMASTAESLSRSRQLHPRNYDGQASRLRQMIKSATPIFENSTEDGTRFRIYRFGSLEVRTTTEPLRSYEEVIGAVFSMSPASSYVGRVQGHHMAKIVKVTEYVDRAVCGRRSFVLLETEQGVKIITEMLANGGPTWEEDPTDLDDRTALARVVRSNDCCDPSVTVHTLRNLQEEERNKMFRASCSECKFYAAAVYTRAIGKHCKKVYGGFAKREDPRSWQWELSDMLLQNSGAKPVMDVKRPRIGDKVEVIKSGRQGIVTHDDHSEMPYKLVFGDAMWPQTKWYKESDLQWLQSPAMS